MNKLMYKMANFFQGRYGIDELYKFLFILFWIIAILSIFIRNPIIYLLEILICVFMFYRLLSRNIYKRQSENMKYLKIRDKVKGKITLQKRKWSERKTHIYRKCPNCKAEIRLPKKKGKHVCTCPRCKKDFEVKCR
ncbi:putative uncharacterized protein [Clostridium sp. CAG:354]|jgi:hypothetical protein|nr:hypothetical protein [Clostridium sp.]MEE0269267.1 hypothetical protein [Clostridia bacterium]CDE10152.1 putative uncharacterized protein [Clostridium sp. CAG:354]